MTDIVLKEHHCGHGHGHHLYTTSAVIIWKQADQYANIILRRSTFHTICTVVLIIGIIFQNAGLRDLGLEAGITAEGSVNRVMDGKMYNRTVHMHKSIDLHGLNSTLGRRRRDQTRPRLLPRS